MNEGQVTIDSHSHQLPQPFLVLATQNPIEHHGTYPLPESQLDRFLMRVRMGYPEGNAEREILRAEAGVAQLENLHPVLNAADVIEIQQAVAQIHVDESLITYLLNIVGKTRESEYLSLGVSPRGSQMLYRAAQAMAFLEGRDYCTPEDFKPLVVSVFAHRVVVSSLYTSTLKKSEQAEQVLREIVESVPVPVYWITHPRLAASAGSASTPPPVLPVTWMNVPLHCAAVSVEPCAMLTPSVSCSLGESAAIAMS